MADSSNTDFAQHSPLLVGPTEVGGESEEHGASKSHGSGVVCSVNFFTLKPLLCIVGPIG